MEIKPTGNYSYIQPETHRDVFRIILLVLALAVVAFVVWMCAIVFNLPSSEVVPISSTSSSATSLVNTQKNSIMQRIRNVDTQPLTSAEKSTIVNFVSSGGTTYTTAEKDALIKVLRGQ